MLAASQACMCKNSMLAYHGNKHDAIVCIDGVIACQSRHPVFCRDSGKCCALSGVLEVYVLQVQCSCNSLWVCRWGNCHHCFASQPPSPLGWLQLHYCGVGSIQWHGRHCIDHKQPSLQEALPHLLVWIPKTYVGCFMALVFVPSHSDVRSDACAVMVCWNSFDVPLAAQHILMVTHCQTRILPWSSCVTSSEQVVCCFFPNSLGYHKTT